MPRAKIIIFNPQAFDSCKKGTEFYETVAADAWIWRSPRAVFFLKIIKNLNLVFPAYVNHMIRNIVFGTEFAAFLYVKLFAGTIAAVVKNRVLREIKLSFFPQGHRHSGNNASFFLE